MWTMSTRQQLETDIFLSKKKYLLSCSKYIELVTHKFDKKIN